MVPMRCAPTGVPLRVAGFLGDADFLGRMAEMGLVPGARLFLVSGGNPALLRLGETRLLLGGDAADRVLVAQESDGAGSEARRRHRYGAPGRISEELGS